MKKLTFISILTALSCLSYFTSCASQPENQEDKVEDVSYSPETNASDVSPDTDLQIENTAALQEPEVYDNKDNSEDDIQMEPLEDEEGFFMSDKTILKEEENDNNKEEEVIILNPEPYQEGKTYYEKYYQKKGDDEDYDKTYLDTDPFEGEDFSESSGNEYDYDQDIDEENGYDDIDIPESVNIEDDVLRDDISPAASNNPDEAEDTNNDSLIEENSDTENQDAIDTKDEEEPQEITASRSVSLQKNQYLEVIYPGSGWVYLGEKDDTELMRYFGRKRNSGKTSFTLRARAEGTTLLHFYKNDPLTGRYLDDYLEIIILSENGSNKT
ncbi:hypothetical protein, partial [Treponema sp.]|uniref:hypothetical protein n=1 Tax=Treponema sp. TaxID=166 RepID=UPI0025EA7C37